MSIQYVQTDDAHALPLLWNGDYAHQLADPAWAPFAINGTNVGLNAIYANIGQFTKVPNCIVQNNRVLRPNTTTNNTTLTISALGGTRLLTSREVEAFSLTLTIPGLYGTDDRVGFVDAKVSIGVYFRVHNPADPNNTTNPWYVVVADYVVSGKQRAEILKTISSGNLRTLKNAQGNPILSQPEILDILIVRNTPDHTGNMKLVDEVYVKELSEIVYAQIAYNNTALVGVKIRATDQLSGQPPAVTSLVKGTRIAVPSNHAGLARYDSNGNYNYTGINAAYAAGWIDGRLTWDEDAHSGTKYWSDNPVWCLYDLLTNQRYGLGQYYPINPDKIGLMRANFYMMAKYCDEPLQYVDTTGATDVVRWRPRFSLNIVIDQTKSATEWVAQICSCMRASAYYSEGIFWIDIDRPKLPTQIFNMSNIKDYVQSGTSFRQIPNCLEVQYVNPLQNYEIDSFRVESPDLQLNPQLEERKKALMLIGVTNFEQARSLAKFTLMAGAARSKLVAFKTGTDAIRCMVTDIIGIQHDVPLNGYGGKIASISGNVATLSEPYTFVSGTSYYMTLADSTGMTNMVSIAPTVYDVSCSTVILPGFQYNTGGTFTVAAGVNYVISVATNSASLYRVVSLKRDADGMCEVTAVDYVDDLYSKADTTGDMGVFTVPNYSLLTNPQRASVTGVSVSQKVYQDSAGNWKVGAEVYYSPPVGNSFWKGAILYYAAAGTTNYKTLPESATGSFFIPELPTSGEYRFIVTSTFVSGKQTVDDALNDWTRHPWADEYVSLYVPNDAFLSGVQALGIENRANDGTFLGKDCIITWKRPSAIDAAVSATAGDEIFGAGVDTSGGWFKEYLVEIKDADTGSVRRTSRQVAERFIYTHEMNAADGRVARTFTITVIAYDRLGRASYPKTLLCSNPAPAAIV